MRFIVRLEAKVNGSQAPDLFRHSLTIVHTY